MRDADGSHADSLGHEVTKDVRRPLTKTTARVEGAGHLLERGIQHRAGDVRVPGAGRLRTAYLDSEDLRKPFMDHPFGQVEPGFDVRGAQVVRQLVDGAGSDARDVVVGRPRDEPDRAGDGAHSVVAVGALDEHGIVRVAQRERDIDPVWMPDPGEHGALVFPRSSQLAPQLAPRVGFDQALQRRGVARIVSVDAKAVAALVRLPQTRHRRLVERGDTLHFGQRGKTSRGRQREDPRQPGRVIVDVDLDLVVRGHSQAARPAHLPRAAAPAGPRNARSRLRAGETRRFRWSG